MLLHTPTAPPPTLRFYQRACIDRTFEELASAHTDGLDVLPTGAGKTNTGLELLHEGCVAGGGRALWIAHRRELIRQPVDRMMELHPEYHGEVGVVMGEHNDVKARLVVATVQTLASDRRLQDVLRWGAFDYLVTDEAHHSVSKSYVALLGVLRERNPALRHVGFTATPMRADGDGLRKVFSVVPYKVTIRDMIGWGYLLPIKAFAVETAISIAGVRRDAETGEFNQKQLTKVYDVDNCFDLVVKTHLDRVQGKQGICFTAGVAGAHLLAQKFRERGVAAAAVDGTTPVEVRDGVLRRFRAGDLEVICNCQVFTEGLDLPQLQVCHIVAPVGSDAGYMQRLGRVLRPFPGQDEAYVFDYVPADARNIVMAGDVLGKPRAQKQLEAKAAKAGVLVAGFSFTGHGAGIDGDPEELFTRPLDYLAASPYQWFVHNGMATLNLGSDDDAVVSRILVISRPAASDGLHRLAVIEQRKGHRDPLVVVKGRGGPDEYARLVAEGQRYAEEHAVGAIAQRGRGWHEQPATVKQKNMIRALDRHLDVGDVAPERMAHLTAREAAQLITHALARRALANYADRRRPVGAA